jgi:hypothetical protein
VPKLYLFSALGMALEVRGNALAEAIPGDHATQFLNATAPEHPSMTAWLQGAEPKSVFTAI